LKCINSQNLKGKDLESLKDQYENVICRIVEIFETDGDIHEKNLQNLLILLGFKVKKILFNHQINLSAFPEELEQQLREILE
jgi:hypothetical protein